MKKVKYIIGFLFFTLHAVTAQESLLNQHIDTSDGDSLATNISIPKGEGPFPVILMRTPYDKDQRKYGALFNSKGYVFVVQDVRGRGQSTGQFRAWIDEELDGIETIDWITSQPWCDGNIGVLGSSYSGYAAMQLAGSAHPALKAIVNNSGPANLYDVIFPGGAFHATAILPWTMAITHNKGFNFPPYTSGLSMNQLVRNLPLSHSFEKNGYEGVFWDYLIKHQVEDTYWDKVNIKHVDRIKIPILHITGWYDFIATSALDGYKDIVNAQKKSGMKPNQDLWVGPWIHDDMMNGRTAVGEVNFGEDVKVGLSAFLERSIAYFDQHLKPHMGFKDNQTSFRYFETGSNTWIESEEWPQTTEKHFYLGNSQSTGTLSLKQPKEAQSLTFKHDPMIPVETNGGANIHFPFFGDTNGIQSQLATQDGTSLWFTSSPLSEDLHIFGKISARIHFSTTARDADLAIKLNQVDAEGRITNIVDGIQRISLRKNRRQRTFSKVNVPVEVEVDLGYISTNIPAGHRLNIQISGSNYPKYGLNPGTKKNALTTDEFKSYEQTIHFSQTVPSLLSIPVR